MSQDEFTKLFKYIQKMDKRIEARFDTVGGRFDNIDVRFDQQAKMITDYHQEMMALAHKVDRLEKWIHQIAEKTGVKLDYS